MAVVDCNGRTAIAGEQLSAGHPSSYSVTVVPHLPYLKTALVVHLRVTLLESLPSWANDQCIIGSASMKYGAATIPQYPLSANSTDRPYNTIPDYVQQLESQSLNARPHFEDNLRADRSYVRGGAVASIQIGPHWL